MNKAIYNIQGDNWMVKVKFHSMVDTFYFRTYKQALKFLGQ